MGKKSDKPKKERHLKKFRRLIKRLFAKKWLVISLVVILVASVGGGVWLYVTSHKQVVQSAKTDDVINQTVVSAAAQANGGDTVGAVAAYDKAISDTTDSAQKRTLLLGKASVYYNEGNYDQALLFAQQAESIGNSADVAEFFGSIYDAKGDSQKAIEYYQKAIDLAKAIDPEDSRIDYDKSQIEALGGVVK